MVHQNNLNNIKNNMKFINTKTQYSNRLTLVLLFEIQPELLAMKN